MAVVAPDHGFFGIVAVWIGGPVGRILELRLDGLADRVFSMSERLEVLADFGADELFGFFRHDGFPLLAEAELPRQV